MSTLNVSNITDGTDTVETGYVLNGSAKAWFHYDQTGNTVQNSFNTSSITDDSAGVFTNSFTSNMADQYWAAGFITRNNRHQYNTDSGTASGRAFRTANSGNTTADTISNTCVIHGELA